MKIKPQIKAKTIVFVIITFAGVFFNPANAQTLQVFPAAIYFNYDWESNTEDALTMLDNGAGTASPEFSVGERSDPAAYIMGQSSRKIWVEFEDENEYEIKAHLLVTLTKSGGTGDAIGTVCNIFIPNYPLGSREDRPIQLTGDLPDAVGKHQFEWEWEIYAIPVNEPGFSAGWNTSNTEHTYYTILAAPIEPVEEPWANVLDLACSWAANADTEQEILAGVTVGAYNYFSTIKEYTGGSDNVLHDQFNLTQFLSSGYANCEDMSAVVQVFTWMLGGTETEILTINNKVPDVQDFYYKRIKPIGSSSWWENGKWNFHQVGWLNNVYDACIMLDSIPRVPVNEDVNGSYKEDLYNSGSWVPYTGYTFHYTVVN